MQKTVLQEILFKKIIWLNKKKKQFPLHTFKNQIKLTKKNFHTALTSIHPSFILECKKHSPSLGLINKHFNIEKITRIYKKYASVISILTDEDYFHGKFEYLSQCRSITHQPILCKDFFIDEYQIYLARYYQADAILLMLSVLNDYQYKKLSNIAQTMHMGILTEVHNLTELNRAIALKAKVIGINNRNLHDLTININQTKILAIKIPKNTIIISESGISNYNQIRELSPLVDGFLIGSSLMQSTNLDESIRCLIMGKNKICGLTRIEDAKVVSNSGAIYGGLIFCKKSIRNIDEKHAYSMIKEVPMKYIGVFCNESIFFINKIINNLNLYGIQLHGKENQDYINNLFKIIPKSTQIWKAISIDNNVPLLNWNNVNNYILDNKNGGGTGKTFNWSVLNNHNLTNVFLAGGLNINNCFNASTIGCIGLDFNSGVEISPGIKDKEKIKIIFKILRHFHLFKYKLY
ncbi:Tryptophan biosynthesis protein TrpCF [Buchnera aphidicola (Eriosoma lanigerum)]|uniref:bifunctional indole-3-glycerol-phosphate synthase TrpC/phosphoribosylanthranilate isomerase TrpF n=1 Tax=Buchnera aphidicola TaxID=9 RepID=UPI0034640093